MKKVRKAVIPAAGLGTRFLPATKAQPKEMLPLVDKPILQYIVEEARDAGIEDLLIVTSRGKESIENHFDAAPELERFLKEKQKHEYLQDVRAPGEGIDIHFIRQGQPLGLGHAIYLAARHVGNEPFAVLLGDEVFRGQKPALSELIAHREQRGGSVIAVREVPADETRRYGIIDPEPLAEGIYSVKDLVEKPQPEQAPSRLAIVGRYVLEPEIFAILEDLPPGYGGEIQLTDALKLLRRRSPLFAAVLKAYRFDVGEKLGYIKATVAMALNNPELADPLRSYLRELLGSDLDSSREAATGKE